MSIRACADNHEQVIYQGNTCPTCAAVEAIKKLFEERFRFLEGEGNSDDD